jgi:CRP-like cAMP-binding protein
MQAKAPTRHRNALLAHLSDRDLALLEPNLRPVPLDFRKQLQQSSRRIRAVYFVESGLGSVVAIGSGSRKQAEVALIGYEGMTGLPLLYGTDRSPCDVFMQVEGEGQCIDAKDFCEALDKSTTLLRALLRFAHVFNVQASYTALANAQGNLEQRLARWLLMAQDRLGTDEMLLTHEFLALMLGVRRAGVTTAQHHFVEKGLIKTTRGSVTILDRDGLVESADGLYGQPEAEAERLFFGSFIDRACFKP